MTALTLQKNQALSLAKPDGTGLTKVRLGLGWDAKRASGGLLGGLFGGRGGEIDLDASAILIGDGRVLDTVYFNQLRSTDGSITHTGDNLTGEGEGDDEQIIVDLTRIDPRVYAVVFAITSYSGQTFDQVENVFARVVDIAGSQGEVVRYDLGRNGGNGTANIIAKLTRNGRGWDFTALGAPANGKTPGKLHADVLAA
jgi:tellurium resistance protein TerZ